MTITATTAAELQHHDYKQVTPGVYAFIDKQRQEGRVLLVQDDDSAVLVVKPWGRFEA
jgi:hypothetical protein